MSSLHITFNTEAEWQALESEGFLSRVGLQYHWMNRDYGTFEDFLGALKQSKRKSIRQVRPIVHCTVRKIFLCTHAKAFQCIPFNPSIFIILGPLLGRSARAWQRLAWCCSGFLAMKSPP